MAEFPPKCEKCGSESLEFIDEVFDSQEGDYKRIYECKGCGRYTYVKLDSPGADKE